MKSVPTESHEADTADAMEKRSPALERESIVFIVLKTVLREIFFKDGYFSVMLIIVLFRSLSVISALKSLPERFLISVIISIKNIRNSRDSG